MLGRRFRESLRSGSHPLVGQGLRVSSLLAFWCGFPLTRPGRGDAAWPWPRFRSALRTRRMREPVEHRPAPLHGRGRPSIVRAPLGRRHPNRLTERTPIDRLALAEAAEDRPGGWPHRTVGGLRTVREDFPGRGPRRMARRPIGSRAGSPRFRMRGSAPISGSVVVPVAFALAAGGLLRPAVPRAVRGRRGYDGGREDRLRPRQLQGVDERRPSGPRPRAGNPASPPRRRMPRNPHGRRRRGLRRIPGRRARPGPGRRRASPWPAARRSWSAPRRSDWG